MMNLRPLRPDKNQKVPTRWSYHPNTENFVGWVNKLGIERTWLGRLAYFLDTRFHLKQVALLFLFALAVSFFISWDVDTNYLGYKEGDVAVNDIRSPLSFEFVDREQTQARRFEAEESVPPVYDFDSELYEQLTSRIHGAFRKMRGLGTELSVLEQKNTDPSTLSNRQADFESDLGGIHFSKEVFLWLLRQGFSPHIELTATQILDHWGNYKIAEDLSPFKGSPRNRVIINILARGLKGEEFVVNPANLVDTTEVRKRILSDEGIQNLLRHQFPNAIDLVPFTDFVRSLVIPNLTLNKQETEVRRQRALDGVSPVIISVRKGQLVAREGEALQRVQIKILGEMARLKAIRHKDFVSLMTGFFFLILLLCYNAYLTRFMSRVRISQKDAFAIGSILVLILGIAKFILFIANLAFIDRFTSVPTSFYHFVIPASMGAMMVGLIIPFGEVVWLFSIILSVSLGFLLDHDFIYMVITFTASVVAARGVYGCKNREDLYWAGIKTGLVNAALIFCATFMNAPGAEIIKHELLWNVPAGLLSGIIASLGTLTLIPLWENIFSYTTDIRLLELSNLNHPLLKDLIVKAPGTYHHSLVVGSMCEAAAEEIGANSLLAKVCAYYHDIGKTNHAQYFIENQRPGENRHDTINPGMSKTILVAHVKEGVDMALHYKLGAPIIDVIEQHHGTTLISFFYHKAKESEDVSMHEVSEDEYRYPGPKPQFREAALCMLADSIEAAARSLDEPTPARLQNIVHNIIQKKFLDGQLDECQITLKDLTSIEDAFSRILLGIYHQRIDYPTGRPQPSGKKAEQTVS